MPEGDTIHRTARNLGLALAGRELTRFEAPRLQFAPFPPGTVVESVDAVGKHCLIRFDDGRTLRTHMRMTGSWHLYKPGERWRKKPAAMRALLAVEQWVAVCFAAPEVELVRDVDLSESVGHLGPDLCLPDADVATAARRLHELSEPDREIGDALLDQRIACGVGNVWKSESLFVDRVDPFTPVGALDDETSLHLLATAARLLREQVQRPTHPRWVYGRRDLPCRVCGTPISWRPQGRHLRGTYWCPTCQTAPSAEGAEITGV
ncbi:MAG TPA: DNA-formamidopyrimidine glycosylase family protein [Acidimicrobiales bacterium]|nr:DNA-formamidopyrimidine glycosylase family protein [Acidimicrobiales bacterium]